MISRCPLLALSGHRLVRCTCPLLTQSGHAVFEADALIAKTQLLGLRFYDHFKATVDQALRVKGHWICVRL